MEIGQKNEKGHLCIGKVNVREGHLPYVKDGYVFEYKAGRPKGAKDARKRDNSGYVERWKKEKEPKVSQ